LSAALNTSVMCRVPCSSGLPVPATPFNKTLGHVLSAMGATRGTVQHKWCGSALLITYPSWYRYEQGQLSWRTEKHIRRALAKPDGMALSEVLDLAQSLNAMQAASVSGDHPSLAFLRKPDLYAALARLGFASQVQSPSGVPLTPDLAQLLPSRAPTDDARRADAFRIVEKKMVPTADKNGKITFVAGRGAMWWMEIRHADGAWRPLVGILRPREDRPRRP